MFDLIVDKLIKKDDKETLWKLCATYQGFDYNKVIDYYVEQRNSYYIEELVCITDGELDQEYLVTKMIETKDKDFIKLTLETCGKSMQYSMDDRLLEQLLTYIKIS